eukprot:TRINITY_DN9989_c0_g1_i3.p1 TRINITY_DN9989_c0_g1~~TRINITY_DN9989_c0_g1_i3.p1  ORF type:complete len:250 (+),score=46.18 TRINITY_DN9989_c0_g1_i3:317-1066(+)
MTLPACWVMRDRIRILARPILAAMLAFSASSILGALLAFQVSSDALAGVFGGTLILLGVVSIMNAHSLAKDCTPVQLGGQPTTALNAKLLDDESLVQTVDEPKSPANGELDTMNPMDVTITGEPHVQFSQLSMLVTGFLVGIIGGLLGLGAGVLMMPVLTGLFRLHKDDARALTLAVLCPPTTLGAVLKYSSEGDVKWGVAVVMLVCYLLPNHLGAKYGRSLNKIEFAYLMGTFLIVIGIVTCVRIFVS